MRLCDTCNEPFTEGEWLERHTCHEPDCHRWRNETEDWCDCDFVCHAECCPECEEHTK